MQSQNQLKYLQPLFTFFLVRASISLIKPSCCPIKSSKSSFSFSGSLIFLVFCSSARSSSKIFRRRRLDTLLRFSHIACLFLTNCAPHVYLAPTTCFTMWLPYVFHIFSYLLPHICLALTTRLITLHVYHAVTSYLPYLLLPASLCPLLYIRLQSSLVTLASF